MSALLWHELRVATRRWSWPIALFASTLCAAAFVVVWGPSGVPLWSAPLLLQLTALYRLVLAMIGTWMTIDIVAPESDVRLRAWCAVVARGPAAVLATRTVVAGALALVMCAASLPAFVTAQQMSDLSANELAVSLLSTAAFGLLATGLAAMLAVATANRVHAWLGALMLAAFGAFAARALPPGISRVAVPAMLAVVAFTTACGLAARRWPWPERATR